MQPAQNMFAKKSLPSFRWTKKYLAKLTLKFAPKNKRIITELLDLKFNNDYDEISEEYK